MPRLATPLSALAVVGASVALAACGGSSGSASSGGSAGAAGAGSAGGTSTTGTAATADRQKFEQCLKDNGVTPPSGGQRPGGGYGPPGGGNGQPGGGQPGGQAGGKFGKAMQACAKYRPQGMGPGGQGGGQRSQQNIQAFTPYLNCLKDQGLAVKVSDGFNALRGLKQSDPKVQAAFKACQSKLPQRPNGNGGGAAGGTSTAGAA
jgi:hypothetical protein